MIVAFPDGHFGGNKQRPLSRLMIASLLVLCAKQKEHIPLTYRHAPGSFTALVNRGLIVNKEIIVGGKKESIWKVTIEAIRMLNDLGFEIPV